MSSSIAVFDSGIGGLTVVRALRQTMPHESIVYLGDTARVPYGTKSASTIQRYALQAAEALAASHPKLLIVACNTASAYGLESLQKRFAFPVVGVIEAGARAALRQDSRIAVLATRATVASDVYARTLRTLNPSVSIYSLACPLLVSLVEEGWWDDPITEEVCHRYLSELPVAVHTVILGCTHYPVLLPILKRLRPDLHWVDSGTPLAEDIQNILSPLAPQQSSQERGSLRLWVTDESSRLRELASKFLGEPAPALELVNL
ncbi:MAG: glutamate racemase [Holophagaceae bacterium]